MKKICARCRIEKSLDAFFKGKGPYGRHSYCKSCVSENRSEHYKKNPNLRIKNALWSRYRLRPEDLENLFKNQNNSCAICTIELNIDERSTYHIDHCHESGKIRGVLCQQCNRMLGWFENRKSNIINYLGL